MLPSSKHISASAEEASRVEAQKAANLKRSGKLSLVVDLDQTLLHAAMDPEIGEWIANAEHPNHEAAKDIKLLRLADPMTKKIEENSPIYYVKFRNGLREFIQQITPYFELHIYTMGTWPYADAIAQCLDPEGRLFDVDRIMTRDRNFSSSEDGTPGSAPFTKKQLKSLFPCQDDMVLILDDRVDVWESSPNLIRIKPYEFFKGYGDLNDPSKLSQATSNGHSEASRSSIYPNSPEVEMQDRNLLIVKDLLLEIHHTFYENLKLKNHHAFPTDVKVLLAAKREKIFSNCRICFSGVIPLNSDPTRSDIWKTVVAFGGVCTTEILPGLTHLVSASTSTDKCVQLRKFNASRSNVRSAIWLVRPDWIYESIFSWKRLSETDYVFKEDERFFSQLSTDPSSCSLHESKALSLSDDIKFALASDDDEDRQLLEELSDSESQTDDSQAKAIAMLDHSKKRKFSFSSESSNSSIEEDFALEIEQDMLFG